METSRYVGLNDLVDELARKLTLTPFSRSSLTDAILVDTIAKATQDYLRDRLVPLGVIYDIWRDVAESGNKGIRPVYVFGNAFVPDLVVEVADKPTLAFYIRHIKSGSRTADKIGAAVGEALLYSHQYPAVIAILCQSGKYMDYMHLMDREIIMSLWHERKVRLVFR